MLLSIIGLLLPLLNQTDKGVILLSFTTGAFISTFVDFIFVWKDFQTLSDKFMDLSYKMLNLKIGQYIELILFDCYQQVFLTTRRQERSNI